MDDGKIQGKLKQSLQWPLYLVPLLIVMTCVVGMISPYAATACVIVDLFYAGFLAWWMLSWRRETEGELVDYAAGFRKGQLKQMMNLPLPYAVLGSSGETLWVNIAFEKLLPYGEDAFHVSNMIPSMKKGLPDTDEMLTEHIRWEGRAYEAQLQKISDTAEMYSLFLFDETSHLETLTELKEQRSVVGQVYIDNYEDAMSSTEQVRQSLLAALIERKISKYFANYDAQIRKTEKDKFSVFLHYKGLQALMEDRFSILEDVKTVSIGNDTAVTLSISMATNYPTLEEDNEHARNAMNLALGRGGDQAIVKTPDDTKFYGGKTQRQEQTTRVKARVKAQALRELMLSRDHVLIMGHHMPDMDCFGAAVGIYRAAKTLDKKAHIVMDEVTSSLRPIVSRFRNNPDYPGDMIIRSEAAKELLDAGAMVVVVDVNRPSYTECPALLDRAGTIVVLDHHRQSGEVIRKATLSYIEPYASSASEMVAEVLQYFSEDMKIRPIEAETIYAGIVLDTNNFVAKAGVRTFEAAAFLRRHGADVTRVRKLFRERLEDTQAKAAAVSGAEKYREHYALGVCDGTGIESPTVVGAQAANELLDIIGVKASFVFTEYKHKVYISARSIDEVNVQLIMERLGGGGHLSIAGAQLENCTVEEARRRLKDTLDQMLAEGAL